MMQKCDDFIAVRNHLPDWLIRRIIGDIPSTVFSGQGMRCTVARFVVASLRRIAYEMTKVS